MWELRLTADIELEIGNRLRIGRPPESGAESEFLGIDPIETAVTQGEAAALRQALLFTRCNIERDQVPSTAEGEGLAVGRELRVHLSCRRLRKLIPYARGDVDKEDIAAGRVEQFLTGGRPLQTG